MTSKIKPFQNNFTWALSKINFTSLECSIGISTSEKNRIATREKER